MKKLTNSEKLQILEKEKNRLSYLLEIHKDKITAISNLTNSITNNYSTNQIVQLLKTSLIDLMKIRTFGLFINTSKLELILDVNFPKNINLLKLAKDCEKIKKITNLSNHTNPIFNQFDFVIPSFHKETALAYLFIKDIEIGDIDCSEMEKVRYIQTLMNLMIISLENKKLFRKVKSSKRIQEEIDLAAEVQKELIPSSFPINSSYEFDGKYLPFDEIGGDFYDLIHINKNNIAFCICDVSGKGVSAGMLMSNFQATIKTLLSKDLTLIELVKQLNTKFISISKFDRFVSIFIAKLNIRTRELEYINAGHNHPVLLNGTKLETLEKGCTLLGILKDLPFIESETIILKENSFITMYTDGLSEVKNVHGEQFDIKNIKKHLIENKDLPLKEFTANLMEKVKKHRGNIEPFDDMSLLCAKFPFGEL